MPCESVVIVTPLDMYPECPEDFEVSQEEWEAYCRDMEEMRLEYERPVFDGR